ncbi:PAS domain-containing protein [Streptomyces winkii]|uniref:PAS domain-containing protein n=1 Tax=Streptomyces winkii TaxID=3051178 RepID=UPI0028D7A8A8|nr:PAS domain-containing protein [Streptomyces sp. DSM 40971]
MSDNDGGDRAPLPEQAQGRAHSGWQPGLWADRLIEQAGVGVTVLDRDGVVLYYNAWAAEHLDRKPEYIGEDVRRRHRRAVTNPRFDAMTALFENGRTEPVRYVARPYGKTTILVTVSPVRVGGELVGFSQIVLLKDEVQELCRRFDESGRESFEREMLPHGWSDTDGSDTDEARGD